MKMIDKFIIFLAFYLFFFTKLWCISFPETSLFPVNLSHSFSLFSDKGNRIDFYEIIQLPDDVESGVWVLWKCKFFFSDKSEEEYIITLWLNYEGEIYLYSLKDKIYERGFDDIPLVYSSFIEYNKLIPLGKNIFLTYLGDYNNFVHSKTKMKLGSVIKAKLNILNNSYFLYFVKNKGLYIIETQNETFVRK